MSTSDRDSSAPKSSAPETGAASVIETSADPTIETGAASVIETSADPTIETSPEEPAAAESVKPKKRRKKRRPELEKPESEMRPELDGNGRERPRFLLAFPKDAELEKLMLAFESGNYAKVRALAPKVIETSEEPEVQAAAHEILRRIEPDPLVKLMLMIAVALFVAVVVYAYHSHA